ncbi:hypothetical protein C0993_003166 [Termitomyces sp. T159_Od127]|nr:hypothetical protein C0993_003166 [Termitomyces sp. T159_Od127]
MEHLEIYAVWNGYSENIKLSLELPRLRRLTLLGCAVMWKVSCFANLRSLTILDLPQDIKPTIHELLDMLQRTPLLEEFSVTCIKHSRELHDTPAQYRTPVHLQYLVCITITCNLLDCFFFFDHLDFSRKAREITLHITSTRTYRKDLNSVTVLRDLAQKIDNQCDGQVQELVVDDPLQFRMSEDLCRLTFCTVIVKFISRGLEDREAFWKSLHLDQLSSLDICEDFDSVEQWSIFSNIADLKTIRITSENGHLLEALGRSTSPEPHTVSLAFPALKHLTISWNILVENDDSGQRVLDQIVTCLELRNSMGLALECLRLEGCFNDDDDETLAILDRLRKYVIDVKTDRDGGDYDSFE